MFAAPALQILISKDLLARVGSGLGLALVATPVAAILAFVDVGDAKSTACGPVLSGANGLGAAHHQGSADATMSDTARPPRPKTGRAPNAAEKKGQKKKFLGIF